MSDTSATDQRSSGPPEVHYVRGRHVVLGMLGFGVLMVFSLWLYWEMYTRPFRPLQTAINAEFPGSSPRVVGGRHKSHRDGSPPLLRIIIRVDFDPKTADEQVLQQHVNRLHALAEQHLDLSPYEVLEIHLIQRVPEQETRRRKFEVPLAT
jgi:hypothetical protein